MKDKVVLITGGAAGIGKATASAFLAEGATVWIWDLNRDAVAASVSEWSASGYTVHADLVDVSDYNDVESAIARIIKTSGQLDVLVNNAGITMDRSLLKMDPATWQKVIDVNLTGVFNCSRVAAEAMAARGTGVILNASSVVGLYGNFGQTNYVATKAGVIGMTKTMARELGRKGIRVNAVAPGFIATEMVQKMPQEVIDGMVSKTPAGRMGTPEDIANAYVFLASDKAAFITGTVISVDGGITI
ncbi:MAG: 3-oxoacyl-ACP reductase FabG [Bacteroidetes bacterium]|nr:3-oxoacyl-ACP reductase FabG [Bacteroidota bacterium]MCH8524489.1 3-oxoacyl-ACP reductase FabG [Balneolales bacterium]